VAAAGGVVMFAVEDGGDTPLVYTAV